MNGFRPICPRDWTIPLFPIQVWITCIIDHIHKSHHKNNDIINYNYINKASIISIEPIVWIGAWKRVVKQWSGVSVISGKSDLVKNHDLVQNIVTYSIKSLTRKKTIFKGNFDFLFLNWSSLDLWTEIT